MISRRLSAAQVGIFRRKMNPNNANRIVSDLEKLADEEGE